MMKMRRRRWLENRRMNPAERVSFWIRRECQKWVRRALPKLFDQMERDLLAVTFTTTREGLAQFLPSNTNVAWKPHPVTPEVAPGVPDHRSLRILREMGYVVLSDLGPVWPCTLTNRWKRRCRRTDEEFPVPLPHIINTFRVPKPQASPHRVGCKGELG